MTYSDQLGLSTHISRVCTFDDICTHWLRINGLSIEDLKDVAPTFMGLPVVVSAPILTIEEGDDTTPILKLRVHKTKWYRTNITPYLISPYEDNSTIGWVIKRAGNYDQNFDQPQSDLSLWQGKIQQDKITLDNKVFSLPNTNNVEKLLSCYFQLLEINKVQVLDLWRAKEN